MASQNHRRLDCLLNRLFSRKSKKTLKLRITALFDGKPSMTGGFLSQRASYAKMFPLDDVIMDTAWPMQGISLWWLVSFLYAIEIPVLTNATHILSLNKAMGLILWSNQTGRLLKCQQWYIAEFIWNLRKKKSPNEKCLHNSDLRTYTMFVRQSCHRT